MGIIRRIIEIDLEYPKDCELTNEELEKMMEVFRIILKAFICDDWKVMISTYELEEVMELIKPGN